MSSAGLPIPNSMLHKNGLRNLTALIVDDNRHMSRLLHTLLVAYGLKDVHDAADGQSAIKISYAVFCFKKKNDYDMKPMNVIAFVKLVRRNSSPPLACDLILII